MYDRLMRFYADGPIIPDELLLQQREGNTIFFCGAGVSMPSGLPSFSGLTDKIIKELGSEKAAEPFKRQEYDRAFNALHREFGRDEIDKQLFKELRAPKDANVKNHENLLTLSRSADGLPQIVTTNFDLLFERAQRNLHKYVPPVLPDLDLNQSIEGLVYLHGRLTSPQSKKYPAYIVSSSDFGRAYLSEGWAAKFVKSLREQFTIVLVGYSAEDPPMRYLLEGLHSAIEHRYTHPIYAFTPEEAEKAEELWSERGVTPIPYDTSDGTHASLWKTVDAWAEVARNPDEWASKVISIAQNLPHEVLPFERGQVCNLISSKEGARAFAHADPAPRAEWLCVFDPFCRYAEPRTVDWTSSEKVDPFDLYHLDDDPPRPIKEGGPQESPPGQDFLAWAPTDESYNDQVHLAAWNAEFSSKLPVRLEALARWFRNIMDEPATVWWAAGRTGLNPNLLWHVKRRLGEENEPLSQQARSFWKYYVIVSAQPHNLAHDPRWYELKEAVKIDGWDRQTVRLFERIIEPFVAVGRGSLRAPHPPRESWKKLELQNVIELKVKTLDRHADKLEIPVEMIAEIIELTRRSLVNCANLMREIEKRWWSPPTLYPTGEAGEHFHGKKVQNYLWFKSLFDRLLDIDETLARREFKHWDPADSIFFGRLCIFYSSDLRLLKRAEAYELIIGLHDDVFWDREHQRELLFVLKELWPELTQKQRRKIEVRIIKGAKKWSDEESADFKSRKATGSASRLRWLQLNTCTLSDAASKKLEKLKLVDERWSDDWARAADDSLGPRGGIVAQVTEPQGLETLPISKIISAAELKTKDRRRELTDYRPFVGLVEVAPFLALSALRLSLKDGQFPERFWQNLLSDWPKETPLRLRWLLAGTLANLSPENAMQLRHYVPRWIKKNIAALAKNNRKAALNVLDKICGAYQEASPDMLSSGIGSTTVGGVIQDKSEVSINKAINSTGGILADALWNLLPKPQKRRAMPKYLDERFVRLFSLPGDGGGHAVAVVAQHMGWLDYWFNDWVRKRLLHLFDPQNSLSEAAWHGLAYDRNGLSHETLNAMDKAHLDVLRGSVNWSLDQQEYRQHIHRLVALSEPDLKRGSIYKFSDVRSVLVAIDDLGRSEAVLALSRIMQEKKNWQSFVEPFLEKAWPKQIAFKGEKTSRAFASLLAESGDNFPEVAKAIAPLLRTVSHLDMFAYYMVKDDDDRHDFARKYPEDTLLVLGALIDENRPTSPYELPKVLDAIADTKPSLKRNRIWRRLQGLTA